MASSVISGASAGLKPGDEEIIDSALRLRLSPRIAHISGSYLGGAPS